MDENLPVPTGEFLLFQSEDGRTRIECRFEDRTLWLSQAQIAELCQVSVPTVNEHLKGSYAEGELSPKRTLRSFRIVRREGSRQVIRNIDHYRDILTDAGRVSRAVADRLALDHYDQFETRRLAAEAQADEAAFESAIKQLPAKSPRQTKKQS